MENETINEAVHKMDGFSNSLAGFLPESMSGLAGPIIALITIVVGYIIAKIAAAIIAGAINKTGFGAKAKSTGGNIGKSLSKAVFWVVWLIFILMGLGQFPEASKALQPINGMLDSVFGYLPKLFSAVIIISIGVVLSKVVKEALSSTLEAAQVDKIASRYNLSKDDENGEASSSVAQNLGKAAAGIVLFMFAITGIKLLELPGIGEMIDTIVDYIPNIFGATVILAITAFIARFISNFIKSTLPALGIDNALKSIGTLDGKSESKVVPSKIAGIIAFVAIMLMGLTAAMDALDIAQLSDVFETILGIGGSVALGAVIIGVGLFIANFISKIVTETSGELAGKIIKYAAMIIFTFMGLGTMNLGADIVQTAFSYSLMAAAVAAGVGGAVAFGLGGREWASKKLEEWMPTKKTTTRKK